MVLNPFSLYDFLGYLIPGMFLLLFAISLQAGGGFEHSLQIWSNRDGEDYVGFTLAAYILGHVLAILSSYTVERYARLNYGYPSSSLMGHPIKENLAKAKANERRQSRMALWAISLILAPVSIIDTIASRLGLFTSINEKLDGSIRAIIDTRTDQILSEVKSGTSTIKQLDSKEAGFFTLIYHYVQEHCENHAHKIYNYVALYGLMRSMTLVFTVLFWAVLWRMNFSGSFCLSCLVCLVTLAAIGFTFFIAYRKYFRRYSLEVLLTLVVMRPKTV